MIRAIEQVTNNKLGRLCRMDLQHEQTHRSSWVLLSLRALPLLIFTQLDEYKHDTCKNNLRIYSLHCLKKFIQ